jgi:hypothetical protein
MSKSLRILLLALLVAVPALAAVPAPPAVNAEDRAAIIDDIAAALDEIYVFPETAKRQAADPERKAEVDFVRGVIEDRAKPVELPSGELQAFAGAYGPRSIFLEDGALWYQRGRGRKLKLLPVGQDRFLVGDLDDFRLRFERDAGGKVVRLVGLYADGSEEPHVREEG